MYSDNDKRIDADTQCEAPTKPDPFTMISKKITENKMLSFEARGLMAYVLGLPPGWKFNIKHLAGASPCGEDRLRRIMMELRETGYMVLERERRKDGTLGKTLIRFLKEPERDFPDLVNTCSGKSGTNNNKENNKNHNNKTHTPLPPKKGDGQGMDMDAPQQGELNGEELNLRDELKPNTPHIPEQGFFPLSPSTQVTAPQVTHSAPPSLPQMLERILRLKAGRDSRGETRKLKPVRDRSETTAWKRIEKFVTEDEVELIEWFYSAPKSKSFDETWNRKTTPATIMNNWTNQLEKAEAFRESRPSSNPIGHIGTPQNWREGVERMLAKPGQSEKTQNIFGAMLQKEDNELNQEEKEMLKQWREMGDI